MANVGNTHIYLLFDYKYTLPGNGEVISLKAGEKFRLVEKLSRNWWSVVRAESDKRLLFVPASYAEELPESKRSDLNSTSSSMTSGGKKELPPKPPVKPKNFTGKREPPTESVKEPMITDEARIELYNILTSEDCLIRKDHLTDKSMVNTNRKSDTNHHKETSFGEYWTDNNKLFFVDDSNLNSVKYGGKGSMQSLDVEFIDDEESSSSDGKVIEDARQMYMNADLIKTSIRQHNLPPWPATDEMPLKTFEGGFEMYCDNESGRNFYFNRLTEERSWILPRKINHSPKNSNSSHQEEDDVIGNSFIWKDEINSSGETICVNQMNGERWVRLKDNKGREYYFNDDTNESRWQLPEADGSDSKDKEMYEFSDKAGFLYRAKLSENGKKIKKSWSHSYVLLCGSMLYFHKDQKPASGKGSLSKPEAFLDMRNTTIQTGSNVRSSRKNLIQLSSTNGTEYLLHSENAEVIEEWIEALSKNIFLLTKLMSTLQNSESTRSLDNLSDDSVQISDSLAISKKSKEKQKKSEKNEVSNTLDAVQLTAEKTHLKEKLKLWLNRRPSRDALRAKGIYKENIFGSHLLIICEKENTIVPKFVQLCINAVEKRGLTVDGIYRVSGNMSDVQKLRCQVNENKKCDLDDPDFDIHAVTGALKLFFRELQEPLFPFRFYHQFLEVIRISERSAKSKLTRNLLKEIPAVNYETMKELLRHLVLVNQHKQENRMEFQNIAIVFGPTLIWTDETDSNNMTSAIHRGQLIEYILEDYSNIFT